MGYKILTVDDSKTIRMIVKKAFKPFDCELFEGENGVEGLAIAAKEKPDLIVLDITMPVMTGPEMLEKLKAEPGLKNIPVIMLTAESGKDNVMKIVKMGVKDYMVKPFKGEQLIDRASKILKLEPKKEEIGGTAVDISKKYFSADGDFQILSMPDKISKQVSGQIDGLLKTKIAEMTGSGMNKLILDLSKVSDMNMSVIQLIISILQKFQKSNIGTQIVGTTTQADSLKDIAETSSMPVALTYDQAKAAF